jgi:PAS domain S-box-containing protein
MTLAFGLFVSLLALTAAREPSVPHALLVIGIAGASVAQAWQLSKRAARLECIAKELAERESRYRMLADSSTDIIMLKRPSGERSYVSPACRVVLGYEPDEFLAIPSATFVHPEDYPRVARLNKTISPEHSQFTSVHRLRHKAGHYVWVEAAFRLTETSVGEPVVLGAIRDVTERHRQDEELKAAKAAADQANAAKTEFLATMSHEIRTPLNGILGYAELSLDDESLSTQQRRSLKRIQTAGIALLTIVNDILDFSKIEAGEIEFNYRTFTVAELVDSAVSMVRTVADKKKLPISVTMYPARPVFLRSDPDRLRQILLNLLNNAVKFTRIGGIKVTAQIEGAEDHCTLRVEVADSGIGIPASKLSLLFRRFSQVDGSIGREFGGTGLGLAISKQLLELLGGEIGVESVEGQGSRFWFKLPVERSCDASAITPARHRQAPSRALRILVAEDVEVNQEVARAILEAAGHYVDVVGNGRDAVGRIETDVYDLVLMDIQMPKLDGIDATKQIRALPTPNSAVPIIALTANVLPQQIASFKAAGMQDHVCKPFKRADLLDAVDRIGRHDRVERNIARLDEQALDTAAFDELVQLLGKELMEIQLRALAEQLEHFLQKSRNGPEINLVRDAHQLVSSGGMLGFSELSASCRAFEIALETGEGVDKSVKAAQVAAERALRAIPDSVIRLHA